MQTLLGCLHHLLLLPARPQSEQELLPFLWHTWQGYRLSGVGFVSMLQGSLPYMCNSAHAAN
jgi:hypothetical protein